MKKLFYTVLFSLPFFTACEEADFGDKAADPQGWEQEEAIDIPELNVSAANSIDLASASDSVTVFNYNTSSELPEGTHLSNFRLEMTATGLENAVPTTINADNNGKIATKDLQVLIESNYGKRPEERSFEAKVYANLMKDGQASLLEAGTIIVKATPQAPFIASAYYMVGDMFAWNAEGMAKFNHSDIDVYDDPIFTLIFTTSAENQYWKIIPQNHVDEGNIWGANVVGVAVDGDASLQGKLVNENAQAGKIEEAGMYKMTLNMMDYTYTISKLDPEYYILGDDPLAWNVNDKNFMLYPQSTTIHSYTTYFKGNVKMINSNDMGSDKWDACYGTATDGDTSMSAGLKQNAGAIHVPEEGYYTLTADFKAMTYTWTKCENQEPTEYTNISLIGDFNGWGGDADLEQIAPHNWAIKEFVVENAGGLKFRANHDWTVNWGATLNVGDVNYGTGIGNGDNINVPVGTYNVFFNDITGEFVFQSL